MFRAAPSLLAFLCLVVTPLSGQGLAAQVDPAPIAPGNPVSLTVTAAAPGGVVFPSSCIYDSIHAGMPNGPFIDGPVCLAVLTSLPYGQSLTQTWVPLPGLPDGLYYFRISYGDGLLPAPVIQWVPFRVQSGNAPALVPGGTPRVGQPFSFLVNAPADGGQAYAVALSASTNAGFTAAGLFVSLDPDPLFWASFPVATPGLFVNFTGTLDPFGMATGITVNIPNLVGLRYRGVTAQAVIVPTSGPLKLSNPVPLTILP